MTAKKADDAAATEAARKRDAERVQRLASTEADNYARAHQEIEPPAKREE